MIDIRDYLVSKDLKISEAGDDNIRVPCFFHGEDENRAGKLYINVGDSDRYGLMFCFVCNERGTLNKIRKHFGDEPLEIQNSDSINPLLEVAARYYHERLMENTEAYEYLTLKRGISEDMIRSARIGWADGGLMNHLFTEKGYTPEVVKESGLINHFGSDTFRDEIIFPYYKFGRVTQMRGKTIGGKTRGLYGIKTEIYGADAALGERTVVITEGECFPPDAQVLTRKGWVAFSDLGDEDVAQVDEKLNIEFVKPLAKIQKNFTGKLVEYSNSQRYYSLTTPGHNVVGSKNTSGKDPVWMKAPASSGLPTNYNTPRVGLLDGPGVPISNTEIRFILAVAADFTVRDGKKTKRYAHAGFKKERKIAAVREILSELEIPYKEAPYKDGAGGVWIHFHLPDIYSDPDTPIYISKKLPWSWVSEMSLEQKNFVLREQALWDGNHVPSRDQLEFSSSHYSEVEWMQTMASTSGYTSTIIPRSNQYGSWFKASILFGKQHTNWQSLRNGKKDVPYDGDVHCVTVPSGMILVRQDDCVSVSGNCDTLTLQQMGFNAVGVPGVHTFKDEWLETLEEAKRIYILFDQDAPGRSGAEKVAGLIGPRARLVELPIKGIDANDWYVDHGKREEDFEYLLKKAKGGLLVTVNQAFERWSEIEGNDNVGGLRFNINELDVTMNHGLLPGQVMSLIARSNSGKTIFSINMFERMKLIKPDIKILFVSLEQARNEWFERAHRIRSFYNPHTTIIDTVEYWKDNLLIIDKNRISEAQLGDSIEQYSYEFDTIPDFVTVDYLGYYARAFQGNSKEQTTDAIMGLKALAREHETVIYSPHQANRTGTLGRRLMMDMAKDASTVEETSDFMLGLWSPDQAESDDDDAPKERTGKVMQQILKSRNGGVGSEVEYIFCPLTLAMVPSSDQVHYKRALQERHYAAAGDTWQEAVARHASGDLTL